jgi:Ca2+-binding RTX toxin-like protein
MTIQQDREQLLLELVNRARLDPAAEAARYGLVDLSAGTGTTITTAAKQVLAWNPLLYNSATTHDQWMIANDAFSHTWLDGTTPAQRMVTAGYGTGNPTSGYNFGSAENIAWSGTSGTLDANAEVYFHHRDLFLSAGHRKNILNANYEELGVSTITDPSYQGWDALVTTFNFAYKLSSPIFVTGVHYTDLDNDDFYSIGESAAGRTVQLFSGSTLVGSTTTAAAGGYQIQTSTVGALEIVYSGGGLATARGASFTAGTLNIKFDLTDGNTIETNVSATLTRDSANLTLLSIDNVNGTGNALDNVIKGNKGNNILDGAGGNDTLIGGEGNDTLIGGTGHDTLSGGAGTEDKAVFTGNLADYSFTYSVATQTSTVSNPDGSIDTVTAVELFQFADGTRTAAQLPLGTTPVRTASISISAPSQTEGNVGTTIYTFTVTLSGPVSTSQSVNFTVSGNGANPADAADFASALSGTVTFLAGESSKQIEVAVVGDGGFEADEGFTVTLSSPSSGLSIGTIAAAATIQNDDAAGVNTVTGTALANTLNGTAGIDVINALGGNDTLIGGAGADQLNGGSGIDIASYLTAAGGVTLNLTTNVNSGSDAEGDIFSEIENLRGSAHVDSITGDGAVNILYGENGNDDISGLAGADTLYGGLGDDRMEGGAGADRIDGGTGIADTATYRNSAASVRVNLSTNINTGGDAEGDSIARVENVDGSDWGDTLTGNTVANTLRGFAGADTLSGLAGNDVLDGGADNDQLFGDSGNDILTGGAGADTLDGGIGTDTASYAGSDLGITVNLLTNVNTGGHAAGDQISNVENVTGSAIADTITGNALANTLNGGGGDDTLDGGEGVDVLIGGGGADQMTGGLGIDYASYRESSAGVTINLASNLNTGGDAEGDTLFGIERVWGSNHSDSITGNSAANYLYGYSGQDTLNGMSGNDYLVGGGEADTFVFSGTAIGRDTIADYVDGTDKIAFGGLVGIDYSDLVFTNQGTTSVTVTGFQGTSTITVKSLTAFTLDGSDFLFT